ncbi:MAG: NAD-dependent dehydratase [Planctomycetes bacterium GWF2_50_10]|nr:MAG: NAD-dependent dehydratase [Planctomycetes bacterium GWF2_50_10]
MKTALITGAAGFIGSHLCDKFLEEGYAVIGVDNFLSGSEENISRLHHNANFSFIRYDVTNFLYVPGPVNVILHFACPASPVDYMRFPIETLKVDSLGTLNTLGLAKAKKAKFVMASTSEVYGDPAVHPQREDYWGNVNPVGPRSVYDEAKRFSEALATAYHRHHGVAARIVRIFNTYGPRMRLDDGRVVPNFLAQALRNKSLTVYGDGSQTRSFCFVSDLVEAIYKVATMENIDGQVFNIGNPEEFKIVDFAKLVLGAIDTTSKIIYRPLPPDDPKKRRPDITKARQVLKWQPVVNLEQGLAKTIAHFEQRVKPRRVSIFEKVLTPAELGGKGIDEAAMVIKGKRNRDLLTEPTLAGE